MNILDIAKEAGIHFADGTVTIVTPKSITKFAELLLAGQWVSVKDRLPEEKDKAYQVIGICSKKYVGGNYDGQGKKGIYQDWVIRQWPNNYTHWMPLPQPPKE